jgi:hypothetical protein
MIAVAHTFLDDQSLKNIDRWRHVFANSKSGKLLATTLAVLECLEREAFVTVEEPGMLAGGRF